MSKKFIRQDAYKKKRLSEKWRKPRGWDSKLRKRMQRQRIVEPGYGTKKELKDTFKGKKIVNVYSLEDLKNINQKTDIVVIGKVGFKKKKEIIEYCLKNKIVIQNIKKPEEYIAKKQEKLAQRKKVKEEKKEEEKKEIEKKESIEEKLSEEEKKILEKREIDRLLTKKF